MFSNSNRSCLIVRASCHPRRPVVRFTKPVIKYIQKHLGWKFDERDSSRRQWHSPHSYPRGCGQGLAFVTMCECFDLLLSSYVLIGCWLCCALLCFRGVRELSGSQSFVPALISNELLCASKGRSTKPSQSTVTRRGRTLPLWSNPAEHRL